MSNSYTVVTGTSWVSRLKSALAGIVIGLVLFLGSFGLLWWNEGNVVETRAMLAEAARVVVTVSPEDPGASDGRLIHASGAVVNGAPVVDPEFGIRLDDALALERRVETYQWVERKETETRDKLGGGQETVTTYSYDRQWSEQFQDSARFHSPAGHRNPPESAWRFRSQDQVADGVTMGTIAVPDEMVLALDRATLRPDPAMLAPTLRRTVTAQQDYFYFGRPNAPMVGDQRVRFDAIARQDATVLGALVRGPALAAWTDPATGKSLREIAPGLLTAAAMIQIQQDAATLQMWILRVAGYLAMTIGLVLVFRVLRVVAAVIPFLGTLVGWAVLIVAAAVSACLTAVTIAIAWIRYRPEWAIPLLIAGLAMLVVPRLLRRRAGAALAPAAATTAGPPPLPPGAH